MHEGWRYGAGAELAHQKIFGFETIKSEYIIIVVENKTNILWDLLP